MTGHAFNEQDRCVCAGYDNGDIKLFDLRNMSVRWETNIKNGVRSTRAVRRSVMKDSQSVWLRGKKCESTLKRKENAKVTGKSVKKTKTLSSSLEPVVWINIVSVVFKPAQRGDKNRDRCGDGAETNFPASIRLNLKPLRGTEATVHPHVIHTKNSVEFIITVVSLSECVWSCQCSWSPFEHDHRGAAACDKCLWQTVVFSLMSWAGLLCGVWQERHRHEQAGGHFPGGKIPRLRPQDPAPHQGFCLSLWKGTVSDPGWSQTDGCLAPTDGKNVTDSLSLLLL